MSIAKICRNTLGTFRLFLLATTLALVGTAAVQAAPTTLDIASSWSYSAFSAGCQGMTPQGTVLISYQNGAYGFSVNGQTLNNYCQYVPYSCSGSGYVGARPISASGFLAILSSSSCLRPPGGSWQSVSYVTDGEAYVTGSDSYGNLVITTFSRMVPTDGLWVIDAENNHQSGRGFQLETHDGMMVFTYYGYQSGGAGQWYIAAGNYSYASAQFTGGLTQYGGGTVMGGSYHAATATGDAGQVVMTFTSPTTGTISLPGEATRSISKFDW
jgi:hypothetical protein